MQFCLLKNFCRGALSTVGASGVHGVPKNGVPSTVGASGVHGQTVKKYFFCRIRCFHPCITIFATF